MNNTKCHHKKFRNICFKKFDYTKLLVQQCTSLARSRQQEAHHKVGLGKTPRHLIRNRCQYSLLKKFEDAFKTALHFVLKKRKRFKDKLQSVGNPAIGGRSCFCKNWRTGKVQQTQRH